MRRSGQRLKLSLKTRPLQFAPHLRAPRPFTAAILSPDHRPLAPKSTRV